MTKTLSTSVLLAALCFVGCGKTSLSNVQSRNHDPEEFQADVKIQAHVVGQGQAVQILSERTQALKQAQAFSAVIKSIAFDTNEKPVLKIQTLSGQRVLEASANGRTQKVAVAVRMASFAGSSWDGVFVLDVQTIDAKPVFLPRGGLETVEQAQAHADIISMQYDSAGQLKVTEGHMNDCIYELVYGPDLSFKSIANKSSPADKQRCQKSMK